MGIESHMFRPRKPRAKMIFVRVSDDEKSQIADAAARLEMPVADFMRLASRKLIEATPPTPPVKRRR